MYRAVREPGHFLILRHLVTGIPGLRARKNLRLNSLFLHIINSHFHRCLNILVNPEIFPGLELQLVCNKDARDR